MPKAPLSLMPLIVLIGATSNASGTVDGPWKLYGQEGPPVDCVFKQTGSRFAGTCQDAKQGAIPVSGVVSGQAVSWTVSAEYNGASMNMDYSGTLTDTGINGKVAIPKFLMTMNFNAVRPGTPPPHGLVPDFATKLADCPVGSPDRGSSDADDGPLGPDVLVLSPKMTSAEIQCKIDRISFAQQKAEFGEGRHAILLLPGRYRNDINVSYFTQISGLGRSPDDVVIDGHLRSISPSGNGILFSFWRSVENMAVIPPDGVARWAVSQAAPFRRMHILGDLKLHDDGTGSGGYIADTKVDGVIDGTRQQQWFTRNSVFRSWKGGMWNMVFVGDQGAPPTSLASVVRPAVNDYEHPIVSNIPRAPLTREKPFLFVDSNNGYRVFVPALRRDSASTSWDPAPSAGKSLSLDRFFVARPIMSAGEINQGIAGGKSLILTPGIYRLSAPIHVTHADQIVLGLGFATIEPRNGREGLVIDDVGGVQVSGILFNAGPVNSSVLLKVGPTGASRRHADNPIFLSDIFGRIGDTGKRSATTTVEVNSSNVVIDHSWLWRADHGPSVGWDVNVGKHALVVNGTDVTAYALMAEHYQDVEVLWNGNGGRTYLFQNEIPANPPWPATPSTRAIGSARRGYPAYKVGTSVTTHEAWGLGSYFFLSTYPAVIQAHSYEVPKAPGVVLHNLMSLSMAPWAKTLHVVNDFGPETDQISVASPPTLVRRYPPE